jgi:hypothetical protein
VVPEAQQLSPRVRTFVDFLAMSFARQEAASKS